MWLTKYNILIILCLPILLLFLIRIYDNYKRKKISTRGLIILLLFWLILTLGILFNHQIFDYLENSNLISSTPLSLYDVIQIAAIILLLYLVFRQTYKVEDLQNKISKLNQEIALKDVEKLRKQ
jgi:hypothetical protein